MANFVRLCDGVREEPLRCNGSRGRLHAMRYCRADEPSGPSVVIAPPDGEERDWAQRTLVTAARKLAHAGCTVLRFDYFGQGESDGDYTETTFDTRVVDLLQTCAALGGQTGRAPVVVGVRLGGTVALAAALKQPAFRKLVLWEPVLDTHQYLHQLLRVNVSMQMVAHGRVLRERQDLIADARAGRSVSVNGYALSGEFIDSLLQLDMPRGLDRLGAEVLAVTTGVLDARLASHADVTAVRVQSLPFWKEPKTHTVTPTPLLQPTLVWLAVDAPDLREAS